MHELCGHADGQTLSGCRCTATIKELITVKLTKKSIIFSVCALLAGISISLCPPPSEVLNGDSMRVLGILVGCIIMWAGNVVHECAVVLLMSALMAGLGHVPVGTVFSAFSGSIVWVLIAAFILGAAMKKCGLLRRIALLLLKIFPKNFAGTSIGLMVVGAVIAPFLPSKNSKGAIVGSVVRSVSDVMGYEPKSRQANGLFLSFWGTTMIIPIMFMSGSTSTIASQGFLPEEMLGSYDYAGWALKSIPFILPFVILLGIFTVLWYKPKKGERVGVDLTNEFLDGQLAELGPWKREEKIVCISTVLMILYWIFKSHLGNIPDYASCLLVLSILWFTGCLDAQTFRNDTSWENIIFIGSCISLGSILPYVHLTEWIVDLVSPFTDVAFSSPVLTVVILVVLLFVIRFILLSEGSYMSIMCALLYPLAMNAGINPFVIAMILNLMVSEFFLPFQSSAFLSGYYSFGDDAFDSNATRLYWTAFTVLGTVAMLIAAVVWQMMGLWHI